MPRRDGFPTNPEMLADFNAAARDVFVAAYERQLESKLPAAYEGKPLGLLCLKLWRGGSDAALQDGSSAIERETAHIQTLSPDAAAALPDLLGWRDYDEDVLAYYRTTAERLGSITLHDSVQLSDVLTASGTTADYTASLRTGRVRHIATFKEKPAKQSIAAGKYFMEEAAAYVQSDIFDKPATVRHANYLFGFTDTDPTEQMQHAFLFAMTTDLPLNGHEASSFLRYFQEQMIRRRENIDKRIARLESFGSGLAVVIDSEKEEREKVETALRRVSSILDSRPN